MQGPAGPHLLPSKAGRLVELEPPSHSSWHPASHYSLTYLLVAFVCAPLRAGEPLLLTAVSPGPSRGAQ
jgi:hypothetical protein